MGLFLSQQGEIGLTGAKVKKTKKKQFNASSSCTATSKIKSVYALKFILSLR